MSLWGLWCKGPRVSSTHKLQAPGVWGQSIEFTRLCILTGAIIKLVGKKYQITVFCVQDTLMCHKARAERAY